MRLLILLLLTSLRLVISQAEVGQAMHDNRPLTGLHWTKKANSSEQSVPIPAQSFFEESEEETRDDSPLGVLSWVPVFVGQRYPLARSALPEWEEDALLSNGPPRFLRFRNFRI